MEGDTEEGFRGIALRKGEARIIESNLLNK